MRTPISIAHSPPSAHSSPDADRGAGGTSPTDIQSHLYHAFLHGRTADVAIRVRGSWEGVYRLHRVVLIQADFFRLLFDGGFRESTAKQSAHDEVNIIFDDPNITRAAFEVCISRLYGGGPVLAVDPRLVPSRREPLTPLFQQPAQLSDIRSPTPRFLLSLLATAIYLSMPALVSQALLLTLGSPGPHTVIRYLNFAIGKGIGEKGENELEAAEGLEGVCREVRYPQTTLSSSLRSNGTKRSAVSISHVFEELCTPQKEEPTEVDSLHSDSGADDDGPVFLYGTVSNKIGEAAACWLCRWGADMLAYEEAAESSPPVGTGRGHAESPPPNVTDFPFNSELAKEHAPHIWRRDGLSASWARAVLSADAFFVRDEHERYDIARRVVELRRRCSIDPAEEKEWDDLFTNGIHYMHMSLEDLIEISQDISPTTGRPYASTAVIQAAHWDQSVLRHHITHRPGPSSPPSPRSFVPTRDGGLGLARTTADISAEITTAPTGTDESHRVYYPVPIDSMSRIGDTAVLDGASMDHLFAADGAMGPVSGASRTNGGGKVSVLNTSANFFGVGSERRTAARCVEADVTGTGRWAPFPPIRFGVEFWGLSSLQEKARLTSQTVWYAGSLFNVYVQLVRKKSSGATGPGAGMQLGMYLHRLSSVETVPPPSVPPPISTTRRHAHSQSQGENVSELATVQPMNIPASVSTPTLHRPTSRATLAGPSRSTTPASPSSSSLGVSPPSTVTPLSIGGYQYSPTNNARPPAQPYRDPRESVRAHFTLLCATPTGGALTRFASAPDAFHVGKSWGWKSSALQTEEHLGSDMEELSARECSLRATIVLGVV